MTSLQSPGRQNNPDPIADLVAQLQRMRTDLNGATGAVLRGAGVRALPGRITSDDFDGVDHGNLGTRGWSLGADEPGGASYLALNGLDVYEALQEQIEGVQEVLDAVADQQAALSAQQAYLSSLISRNASAGSFNTGTMINDSTFRLVGDQAVIANLPVPTGRLRVTTSCSEVSIVPGGNAVVAGFTYAVDGVSGLDPNDRYARLYTVGATIGSTQTRVGTVTMPPGTYTVRAQRFYWSAGSSSASANFTDLRVIAEVINGD